MCANIETERVCVCVCVCVCMYVCVYVCVYVRPHPRSRRFFSSKGTDASLHDFILLFFACPDFSEFALD
jgi:hypothetical protein